MQERECKGCQATVRLAPAEVDRILVEFLRGAHAELADNEEYDSRLAQCASCADLQYGTTCRYCGCLVAVRAKLADKTCPASSPKW